ncbi:MAG: sensor histidine kinase [Planctomycetota bacterium]
MALRLKLQSILAEGETPQEGPARREMEKLSKHCNDLIREVRAICHGLYPSAMESLGLIASLKQFAAEPHGETNINIRSQKSLEDARFEREVEIELYRIIQEAVNNALRHGKAENVDIDLKYRGGELRLAITDNGQGFDVNNKIKYGIGLSTMAERAQTIGGELNISSRPGKTCVSLNAEIPKIDLRDVLRK